MDSLFFSHVPKLLRYQNFYFSLTREVFAVKDLHWLCSGVEYNLVYNCIFVNLLPYYIYYICSVCDGSQITSKTLGMSIKQVLM